MDFAEKLADRLGELFALQEERTRALIEAGLQQTRNALRLQGARPEPITGSSRLVSTGNARLVGWSLKADGGSASVIFYDGRANETGDVIAVVDLIDAESDNQSWGGAGISITEGCYAAITGPGTVTGAVYIGGKD